MAGLLNKRKESNSSLQILVVAYAFPPNAEVGGLRVARFCRYLPAWGISPVVLTVQEQLYEECDDTLPKPSGLRVERTGILPTPLDWYKRWKARWAPAADTVDSSTPAPATQPRGFFRRHTLALLQVPDPYWGWYLPAVRTAERVIEREPITAIFSTSPPWSCHLVARHLKKKYRLPWLADFRDPWVCRSFREDLPSWRNRVDQWLEASCLRWADRVICNTDRLRETFLRLHPDLPRGKFVTLTNGFDDPVAERASVESKSTRRCFLHLGSLYHGRRIDTFCQVVGDLVNTGKIDANSFKILFLGDTSPSIAAMAYQRSPELMRRHCIEFRPRVSWKQAQQALWSADLLLLFFEDKLAVPAKFYEYLQTGKPIFAVAPEGALTDVLQSTRSGVWADPRDSTAIAAKFLEALGRTARSPEEVQRRWSSQYHYRSLTAQLAGWVCELVARTPKEGPGP